MAVAKGRFRKPAGVTVPACSSPDHWGWAMLVDKFRPDRYDLIGALICLTGVALIMYADPRQADQRTSGRGARLPTPDLHPFRQHSLTWRTIVASDRLVNEC